MKEEQYLLLQDELDLIIEEVKEKQDRIVPIIGDDCFVGYVDDEHTLMPLQQWLTEELLGSRASGETKEKISSLGYYGLDLLFKEYERIFPKRSTPMYKRDVIRIIENGIREKRLFLRKDVKDFLTAGSFEVVVTTCPFDIIEKELKCGDRLYNVSSFAPQLTLRGLSRAEATLKLPAIYQLFGNIKNEYVSGENMLLKFLHFLNQTDTEKGYGASPLVKYLKDKEADNKGLALFMPIGCSNLPNWIFRFIWYPFCVDHMNVGDDTQGGVWYQYSSDEDFYNFLINYGFRTFSEPTDILTGEVTEGDPVLMRLTEELHKKASEVQKYISSSLHIDSLTNEDFDLFISYSSNEVDSKIAKKIYTILTTRCGINPWMDSRIKGGEYYWDAIQYGIEHSHKYLFLITDSYLEKAVGKNVEDSKTHKISPTGVYEEIDRIRHCILNKRRDGEKNIVIPLIIEGTKVTYTDKENVKHEDEQLCGGLLETLPYYREYQLMQTHDLFKEVQDVVCNEDNIEEKLIEIFNPQES